MELQRTKTKPPYYAVIFTSIRIAAEDGYTEMANSMESLASKQPGFLGIESARDPQTLQGITVSYWKDLESIAAWKENLEHKSAQRLGRDRWYSEYSVRICEVTREYAWKRAQE